MIPFEAGRTLPAKSLDFWFDYTCPYAYLGSTQARALAARMGVPLTYKPLLLGGVFRAHETPQRLFETLSPAKAAHNGEDLQRWARKFGVSLRMPAGHPIRSVEALRATLACGPAKGAVLDPAATSPLDPKVIDAFYRAYWVDDADISDRAIVRKIVEAAGHDGGRVMEAIDTQAIKDDLKARTDEAIGLGIFGVPSWVVDGVHLYWGQDRMHFVEGLRLESAPAPRGEGKIVDAYFDFSSPFAYLGSTQIEKVARHVRWKPILLGGLFRSIGTPDAPVLTFSEAKRRYVMKDLDRWATFWGVPFSFPTRFPMVTVKALRTYLALPEERRGSFRERVFRAYWAEDQDISDDGVLARCIGDEGVARDAFAKSTTDAIKAELRKATEDAQQRGVFGVPTWIVGGEALYWGQDRLDLVADALG
ncbi:MAG: 2-hydroxychromene-2-carboxylate isomerase [Deltaproteobacteria bacterium]|nr:2-hydroxychromene-2-carboxylate isomerase [Deltaproteobacteria bacterium]